MLFTNASYPKTHYAHLTLHIYNQYQICIIDFNIIPRMITSSLLF